MDNKKKFPVTNIGTATLLMIFIILCMVTFAVLSLSEAAKDRSFSRQLADQTTDYYTACGDAEKMLSDIDSAISDTKKTGLSGNEYYEAIAEKLTDQDRVKANGDTISYSTPVNDRLVLAVSLRIAAPGETFSGQNFKILSWEETQANKWNGNNSVELMQP